MERIIPQDKFDQIAIENLKIYPFADAKRYVPELLTWLQDGNWPVAKGISDYLRPYINSCENELSEILTGSDGLWKYWVILSLIDKSDIKPGIIIMWSMIKLAKYPTQDDIDSGTAELALNIVNAYFNKSK